MAGEVGRQSVGDVSKGGGMIHGIGWSIQNGQRGQLKGSGSVELKVRILFCLKAMSTRKIQESAIVLFVFCRKHCKKTDI